MTETTDSLLTHIDEWLDKNVRELSHTMEHKRDLQGVGAFQVKTLGPVEKVQFIAKLTQISCHLPPFT